MRLRLSILTACALGATALLAAPAPAVLDGTPDGNAHPYVGKLLVLGPAPGQGQQCSGSLVAADLVVTAAHCFINLTTGQATNRNVLFSLDNPALPPGFSTFVPGVGTLHPGFDAQTATPYTDDVAVVRLAASYPGASAFAALPRLQASRPLLSAGGTVDVVGYGLNPAVGPPGFNLAPPWRRFAKTVAMLRGEDQPNHLRVEQSACFGDSGGGFLDGDTLLAVTSVSLVANCGGEVLGYRLDTVSAQKFLADQGVPTKFSR